MLKPSLSIIIPCYEPPDSWELKVIELYLNLTKQLSTRVESIKIVLVNDGSKSSGVIETCIDTITEKIGESSLLFVSNKVNRGKGYALRDGVRLSDSDFYVYTDVDIPYTFDSVLAVTRTLLAGVNIVAGNRDADYYDKMPKHRVYISKVLRRMNSFLLGLKVSDTQCGLKGFDRIGREAFLMTSIDRYLFDLEFIFLASRNEKMNLQAVPVELKEGVIFGKLSVGIMITEVYNFAGILFMSFFSK